MNHLPSRVNLESDNLKLSFLDNSKLQDKTHELSTPLLRSSFLFILYTKTNAFCQKNYNMRN